MKAFAVQAQPVSVLIREVGGACIHLAVAPASLAQAEALLQAEAARLPGLAARLIEDAAAARFAVARERIPAYGAWAYDWVQSYVTSYRVLWRLGRGLAGSMAEEGPVLERISAEIAQPMREAFRERVLAPTELDGRLADAAWSGALDAARAAIGPGIAGPGTAAAIGPSSLRLDFAAAAAPLGPALEALAPEDLLDLVSGDGTEPPAIFLRSMRPMAARLGAVAVRASEAGSLIAAGGTFGYAIGGAPGVALGLAGGVGVSWGIDWLINRIDAALNRSDFESQALAAVAGAEQRLASASGEAMRVALDTRLAGLRPDQGPCG